jgi:hypothetical protein
MESSVQFRISISRRWPGQKLGLPPVEKRWARYNASFRAEEHTPESLLREISKGYSFTAVLGGCHGLCCGTWCTNAQHMEITGHCGRPHGYRRNQHFQSAQFIPLDFDTGDKRSTFDHLLGQPLIALYGSFLYTTLSHTPDYPKARLVFITDAPIIDPDHYRRFKRAVMAQLPWGDASVHDPARLFYGSLPEQGQAHFLGNALPLEVLGQLVASGSVGPVNRGTPVRTRIPATPPRAASGIGGQCDGKHPSGAVRQHCYAARDVLGCQPGGGHWGTAQRLAHLRHEAGKPEVVRLAASRAKGRDQCPGLALTSSPGQRVHRQVRGVSGPADHCGRHCVRHAPA